MFARQAAAAYIYVYRAPKFTFVMFRFECASDWGHAGRCPSHATSSEPRS